MKPILWLDKQILKFFTKIAKDFNWLTGGDNFFLAKVFVMIFFLKVLSSYYLLFGFKSFMVLVGYVFCLFPAVQLYFVTSLEEQEQTKEQLDSVRFYNSDHGIPRLLYWFAFFIFSIPALLDKSFLWGPTTMCFVVAWSYFVSIPKPPFKKSQAWQKIKGWLSPGFLRPQAEPIPVTS